MSVKKKLQSVQLSAFLADFGKNPTPSKKIGKLPSLSFTILTNNDEGVTYVYYMYDLTIDVFTLNKDIGLHMYERCKRRNCVSNHSGTKAGLKYWSKNLIFVVLILCTSSPPFLV